MAAGLESGQQLSWYNAQEWCKNNSATLASITNQYEQVKTVQICVSYSTLDFSGLFID